MKLTHGDLPELFSTTEISDIFFTEHFTEASGDAIKVYLYIYFLSKYNKEIKLNDLSKTLNIKFTDIQNILSYWEQKELIIKSNTGYKIVNLQEKELHKLYSPKLTASPETLEKNLKSQSRAKVIDSINNSFFNGLMSNSWYSDIIYWFDTYHFDEEVMQALFSYCHSKSALHRNYIKTVAEAWAAQNIITFSDLDNYFAKQDNLQTLNKTVSKKLRLNRQLTDFESEYIEKWNIQYGYSLDVIELALKKSSGKQSINFNYFDTILTSWHDHNLKTPDEIIKFTAEDIQKNKNIKELSKKSSIQNFEGRNYESFNDFNNLYANSINIDDFN